MAALPNSAEEETNERDREKLSSLRSGRRSRLISLDTWGDRGEATLR